MKVLAILLSFSVLFLCLPAVLGTKSDDITLQTDYVSVQLNEVDGTILSLAADFDGGKSFEQNVLASPIQLELYSSKGFEMRRSSKVLGSTENRLQVLSQVHLNDVPTVSEDLLVSIEPNSRSVSVSVRGQILEDVIVTALSYGIYVNSPAVYGLFSSGVAQMMGKSHACLGSTDPLERAYFLGDGSALDVIFTNANSYETVLVSNTNQDYSYKSGIQHVLFGQFPHKSKDLASAWNNNCWSKDTSNHTVTLKRGTTFEFTITLIPNNYDFPAYLFNDISATKENLPFIDLRTSLTGVYGSAAGCLQSYYHNQEGIIAPTIAHPDVGYSPDTNFFDPDNFITLSAMLYSGDQYLVTQVKKVLQRTSQTMCGIGTDSLEAYCNQSRQRTKHSKMIQFQYHKDLLSAKHTLLSSKLLTQNVVLVATSSYHKLYDPTSRSGQLMHHFVSLVPTYESIAGSEQLGPNIFWTMTVWKYISVTQDFQFAKDIFPFVDLSCKFVLSFVDKDVGLIAAPGPLWIDVLIREHYTSDSNAIIVPFIEEMIEYYTMIDNYSTTISGEDTRQFDNFVAEIAALKETIINAYNKYLWISNVNNLSVNDTNDHFITQLDNDFVSYRDFIDYDSNLMAVAFKIVTNPDQVQRLISRVDSGPYTHVRATWCSEIPYTGGANDCYIVGGSVCGDSVVTLARIGYIDGIARKQISDVKTYQNLLLAPLQQDLINNVWLYERYDSNGQQIRTSYYFEYPSLVTMFVREISYGVEVKQNEIIIHPFVASQFTYNIGNNFYVKIYNNQHVVLASRPLTLDALNILADQLLPKKVSIYGLQVNQKYTVSDSCQINAQQQATTEASGVLQISVKFAPNCAIDVSISA